MPVISPNAFAPPARAANDTAVPVAAALREKVRRLERAYSAQRAGQEAVPLGVPAIDALLPERPADRRPARDRGGSHAFRPCRCARWRGHGFRRPSAGPLRHAQAQRHAAVVPPSLRRVRCAALRSRARRLVRSGAPADGHGAARRGSVLGHGRRPALPRHGGRAGRDARDRSHRRPPPVARRREERRARAAAAWPARATAKRVHDALARRLGGHAFDARPQRRRRLALAHRTQKKPFRRPLCHRNTNLAPGVER